MSKFSVKKPLTVFVAVIIVIVLGVVSFTRMTPELIPNLDMPYVMVVTPYPGSTPEKTELAVTRPMEQALATLEDIENITSTSGANSSTVMLEFAADASLDVVSVDILQRISQIEGVWDDTVGTPIILKLNPNMLPVMVAAASMEGMDAAELSAFMKSEVADKLDGIDGVASVATDGLITQEMRVTLSPLLISQKNEEIRQAIAESFKQPEAELAAARGEIQSGMDGLNAQKAELEGQLASLGGQTELSGADELTKRVLELRIEMAGQMAGLQAQADTLAASRQQLRELRDSIALMADYRAQLQAAKDGRLQNLLDEEATLTNIASAAMVADGTFTQDVWNTAAALPAPESYYAKRELVKSHADYQNFAARADVKAMASLMNPDPDVSDPEWDGAALAGMLVGTPAPIDLMIAGVEGQYALIAAAAELDADMDAGLAEVDAMLAQADAGLQTLNGSIAAMRQLYDGLGTGAVAADDAVDRLGALTQQATGMMGGLAGGQITLGMAQLQSALAQVEAGQAQLDAARAAAIDRANLGSMLTMDTLSQLLTAQHFSMPAGYVHSDGADVLVSVGDSVGSLAELRELVLIDPGVGDIGPIRLSDVAAVTMTDNRGEVYAKINGQDGVLLTFSKQSNAATADASDSIRAKFDELSAQYPGLGFYPLMDQGDYIYIVVDTILENLLLGALFAIVILFLFLRDIRPTFITLCSIPISVIFAIALMYFSGVTINIISLSGLAVAVGMLVDNGIVVIENIYRLRQLGASRVKAAVSGAAQVAGAIASSTLTTVCVFLPIVFVSGITRQLFTDLALTMGYSLMASLVVALTLVPAMSGGMLKKQPKNSGRAYGRVLGAYEKSAGWALRHRAAVLGGAALLLAGSAALVLVRGFSFMPAMSMPQLTVNVNLPRGAARDEVIEATNNVLSRIEGIEGVETTGAMLSGGGGGAGLLGIAGLGGGGGGGTSSTIYVLLDEKAGENSAEVSARITELCADIDAEVSASSSGMSMTMLTGSGLEVNLYGDELQDMQSTARELAGVLRTVPGTADVSDGVGDVDPELHFVVNREKAAEKGLTTAQVYAEISRALATQRTSVSMMAEGGEYDVIVTNGRGGQLTADYIRGYSFSAESVSGEESTVYLRDIAEVIETDTKSSIQRVNQRRVISLSAGIAPGHNVSIVSAEAQRILEEAPLPAGMTLEYGGENTGIMDSFRDLGLMLLLGVLLVYLIMVAQFQSLKSPFIVMFTIPLAFTGGFLALLLAGLELSVIALIGFVMLVGVIVNNGIVLVDYINRLRSEGKPRREAIVEAGVTRMRPILMTSITTILGLSVMAVGRGIGSELMQPVAIVCIGGLVYATLMTLYVVPIMYDMMNRKEPRVVDEEDLIVTDM